MFCPKCGTSNENNNGFCVSCGAELVDNQPVPPSSLTLPKKKPQNPSVQIVKKELPRALKWIIVVLLSIIVIAVSFIMIGSAVTNPKNIAKSYFQAKIDGDGNKMYDYLMLSSSEFVNKESFLKLMENEKFDVVNFEISESTSKSSASNFLKSYTVEYLLKGVADTQKTTITLVKKNKKKLLIYDDYIVGDENLIVSDFKINVPNGSTVYVNDIELTQQADSDGNNSSSGTQTYVIPKIFASRHDIKIEHPSCDTYMGAFDAYGTTSYVALGLTLNDSVKIDLSKKTEDTLKKIWASANAGDDFSKLGLSCAPEKTLEVKTQYEDFLLSLNSYSDMVIKNIAFTSAADASIQTELASSGTYLCKLDVKCTYTAIRTRASNYPASSYNSDQYLVIAKPCLNVRESPNLTAKIVDKADYDTIITIYDIYNGWGWTGLGYVSMDYVIPAQSAEAQSKTTESKESTSGSVFFEYVCQNGEWLLSDISMNIF